jgi:hypothetical protein
LCAELLVARAGQAAVANRNDGRADHAAAKIGVELGEGEVKVVLQAFDLPSGGVAD